MEFNIKKNATLPILKVEICKDGRSDFNLNSFLDSDYTFYISLYDKSIDKILFASKECYVTSEFSEFEGKTLYYLNYQFTNKDTLKTGKYEVQISVTSDNGVIILPLQEKFYVNIIDSFSADNSSFTDAYSMNLPCCGFQETFDVGGLNLEAYYYSGSLIIDYILTSTNTYNTDIRVDFTNELEVFTGSTIQISTGVTITAGQNRGTTQVIYSGFDFDNLTQSSILSNVGITESVKNVILNFESDVIFNTPPPSLTPTNTPTATVTPTITPTITPTSSVTPTPSITPTITPTLSITPTITPTLSITPTITPTNTPTPTQTNTPTNTVTPSVTPTITPTNTETPTNTPTPSITPTISPSRPATLPFASTWSAGTSYSNTITLPYVTGGTYTGTIDWGDGTTSANTYANRTKTYASSGVYLVSIDGEVTGYNFFENSTQSDKILSVSSWGQLRGLNNDNTNMFRGCTYLDLSSVSDTLNMVGITATTNMFQSCIILSSISGVSSWDMSSVVDMSYMFYICSSFNDGNISSWDTSNTTNMSYMLAAANTSFPNTFNQDISGWNVSSVTDMSYMFYNNTFFNQNIGAWDTNSVTTMQGMFHNATSFDNGGSTDISLWRTNSLTNIDSMFRNASDFNQPINSDGSTYWNLAGVTEMVQTFREATSFNQDLSLWDVSNVSVFISTFLSATTFNQDLNTWNVSNVTDASNMLDYTAISTQNYDSLLASWKNLTLQSNVPFGVQGLGFSAGQAQSDRQYIIDNFNWTFVGDAKA